MVKIRRESSKGWWERGVTMMKTLHETVPIASYWLPLNKHPSAFYWIVSESRFTKRFTKMSHIEECQLWWFFGNGKPWRTPISHTEEGRMGRVRLAGVSWRRCWWSAESFQRSPQKGGHLISLVLAQPLESQCQPFAETEVISLLNHFYHNQHTHNWRCTIEQGKFPYIDK